MIIKKIIDMRVFIKLDRRLKKIFNHKSVNKNINDENFVVESVLKTNNKYMWIDDNGDIFMINGNTSEHLLDIPMNNGKQKTCWLLDDEASENHNKKVFKLHDIQDNKILDKPVHSWL